MHLSHKPVGRVLEPVRVPLVSRVTDHVYLREISLAAWSGVDKDAFELEFVCASPQAYVEEIWAAEDGTVRLVVRDQGELDRTMESGIWRHQGGLVHRILFVRRTGESTEIPHQAGRFLKVVSIRVVTARKYYALHQRPKAETQRPGPSSPPVGQSAAGKAPGASTPASTAPGNPRPPGTSR